MRIAPSRERLADLALATPVTRNRYADLIRVVSIGVVVLGHWTMAVLGYTHGKFTGENLLEIQPDLQIITWVFQVMPLFFIVGGFTNGTSWASALRRGTSYSEWLRGKAVRLVRPALWFVAFWTLIPVVGVAAGLLPSSVARVGGEEVALPLWFLAVYLVAIACIPAIHALHRRLGAWSFAALALVAFVIDNLRFGLHVPRVGALNYLLVWGAVLELGLLWADGTLRRRPQLRWQMAIGGLATVSILVAFFDFPVSMIDLTHGIRTNVQPPSIALLALAVWQCGAMLLFEDAGNRWLQRPKPWRRVIAANSMVMTFYLWNMSAVVLAATLLFPTGIAPQPEPLSTAWWLMRPAWWLVCAICIAVFLLAFRWAERPVPASVSSLGQGPALALAAGGTAAAAVGFGMLAANAFPVPGEALRFPVYGAGAVLAAGLLLRVDPIAPLRRRQPVQQGSDLKSVPPSAALNAPQRPWHAAYPKGVPVSIEPIPSTNAYSLMSGAASRYPDRPAIAWFGRHMSYRQLESETARFAGVLSSYGVGRGDRVALILPNCPQYVIAYYAALRIGAVAVGNNPLYTVRELAHQLADAGPSIIVVLDALYPSLESVREEMPLPRVIVTGITDYMGFPKKQLAPLKLKKAATAEGHPWPPVPKGADVTWWAGAMKNAAQPPPVASVQEREPAAFVYTGGTTGVAKGAMLSHRNILANAMQCGAWFIDTQDGAESIMCVLPFFHCYGSTVGMHLGLLKAAKLVLVPRFELKGLLKEIQKERPTLFPGVPRLYIAINEAASPGHHDLSSIRYCLSGAGALPLAVAQRFHELTGATLVEGYGLTEASPVAIGNPLDGSAREGCIGLPIPDTDAKIVDLEDPTRPVATGGQGELCIRGPQVMLGYWNRPDETANVIRDGWLHTGDIAVMEPDGFFRIVDRLKDMIKVSGFNVYPTEVEQVLYRHPDVLKACVIGIPDGQGGEMVKAFIVRRPGSAVTTEEIQAWCRDPSTGLAGFRVPKAIEFRDQLPETLVGKILRRVLVEEERQKAGSASP